MRKSQLIDAIQSAQNGSSGNRAPSGPPPARTDDVAAALDTLQQRRPREDQPPLPTPEPNSDGATNEPRAERSERGADTDAERTDGRDGRNRDRRNNSRDANGARNQNQILKRSRGQIVVVGSLLGFTGAPTRTGYAASSTR